MAESLIGQLHESLTAGGIVGTIFLFLIGSFFIDNAMKPRYPKSLPRVGYGEGTIATMRNWIASQWFCGVDVGLQQADGICRPYQKTPNLSKPRPSGKS